MKHKTYIQVHGLTVDPFGSRDLDDGLGYHRSGKKREVVHIPITNVAIHVKPDSPAFLKAMERIETEYYANGRHAAMIGDHLEAKMSLLPDITHHCLILTIIYIDGKISDYKLRAGTFHSWKQLSYHEASNMMKQPEYYRKKDAKTVKVLTGLHRLMNIHLNDTQQQVITPRSMYGDRTKAEEYNTTSYKLIEFYMKLANILIGKLADKYSIPLIYRIHAAAHTVKDNDGAFERHYLYRSHERKSQRGKIRALKAKYSPNGDGHYALDIQLYPRVTSPLRRLEDLINQQQLFAYVMGRELPWSFKQISKFCLRITLAQTERNQKLQKSLDLIVKQHDTFANYDADRFSSIIILAIKNRFRNDTVELIKQEIITRADNKTLSEIDYLVILLRADLHEWKSIQQTLLDRLDKDRSWYSRVVVMISELEEYQHLKYIEEEKDEGQYSSQVYLRFGNKDYWLPEYTSNKEKGAHTLSRLSLINNLYNLRMSAGPNGHVFLYIRFVPHSLYCLY